MGMSPVKSFTYDDTYTSPDGNTRRVVFRHTGGRNMYAVVKLHLSNGTWTPISLKIWTGDMNRTVASWRTNISDNATNFLPILEVRQVVAQARSYMAWIASAI